MARSDYLGAVLKDCAAAGQGRAHCCTCHTCACLRRQPIPLGRGEGGGELSVNCVAVAA